MEARKPRCPKGQWGFFMSADWGRWPWTIQRIEEVIPDALNDTIPRRPWNPPWAFFFAH